MARKSAEHFREIAKKARLEELALAKQQEAENSKAIEKEAADKSRRVAIWKILYECSLGGGLEIGISNVLPEDLTYFESMGFEIELDSDMPENIELELESLHERRESLEGDREKIDNIISDNSEFDDDIYSKIDIDTTPLDVWIFLHPEVALACGMERWFGTALNSVDDLDKTASICSRRDLDNLLEFAKEKKNISKSPNIVRHLQELIDSIKDCKLSIENKLKVKRGYREIREIESALAEILDRIDFIENNDWEDGAPNIFSWPVEIYSNAHPPPSEYYSYESVKWISSEDGQSCLEKFECLVSELSKKGKSHLFLKIECGHTNISIRDCGMGFSSHFPTLFDLKESLVILGYKVTSARGSDSALRVSW